MRYFSLLVVFLVTSFLANAQTGHHHGCHHTHNKRGKIKPLSGMEKVLLNQSIARSDTFDILSYLINIDVTDYAGQTIKAATTVQLSPLMSNLQAVRFDLYQLQVDSVKDDTGHLTYTYDGEVLRVVFSSIPEIGDLVDITVYYQGEPYRDPTWGGFYFESNYIYNLGIGLTTIPPNFGKVWYPCFDSFVERATYEYHVKSAGTYRAHCQGTFLGETQLMGDTVIRSFAMTQPIPTHLSAIAVAAYEDYDFIHTGANGDVPVRFSAKAANMSAMQNALQNVGGAIDALEYWYGPYGWERVGYVLTTDGALEIPTNIAYPQYMVNEAVSPNNGLLAHELGHHWWGDIVTPHNHNDMWLKEGPAEYSGHLLEEWLYGNEAFVDEVKTNHLDVLKNAHIDDDGFHPLSPMPDAQIYGTHTYYKGASVVHNLRGYLGDSLFRQAMSGVQVSHLYQDVTPEEFRDALEAASGVDLDDFFNDQVFKPGFSTFVVDSSQTTSNGVDFDVKVFIQQKLRECPSFYQNVPLDVTFIGYNLERKEHSILVSGQFSEVILNCDFPPAMVVLNGHNRLNQARMDYEVMTYTDSSLFSILPYVNFRLYKENVVDSSLVRVEHIWAAPDQAPLDNGIFEISDTHYYLVEGLWDENDLFTARVYYDGANATDLDHALYSNGEENAVLLYRPDSSYPWEIYQDFTVGSGSQTNGDGYFVIDVLRRGQYAFANGDVSTYSPTAVTMAPSLLLYPNPAVDRIFVKGSYQGKETALFDVLTVDGKLVQRSSGLVEQSYNKEINISSLAQGTYFLRAWTTRGELLGMSRFEVLD